MLDWIDPAVFGWFFVVAMVLVTPTLIGLWVVGGKQIQRPWGAMLLGPLFPLIIATAAAMVYWGDAASRVTAIIGWVLGLVTFFAGGLWTGYSWSGNGGLGIGREAERRMDRLRAARRERRDARRVRRWEAIRPDIDAEWLERRHAVLLDEDEKGTLWRIPDFLWGSDLRVLEVENSTEVAGERPHYFIPVPPMTRRVHEALAWTFHRNSGANYRPRVET